MLLQTTGFPFSCGWIILHYMCVSGHLCIIVSLHVQLLTLRGCFQNLTIANNAATNMGVQISPWYPDFIPFGYVSRSWTVGSYGSFTFNLLRNLHAVFHTGCTNLHSYPQCTSFHFSPYPHQHLYLVLLMIVLLIGMRWHLFVVLIWIF